MADTSTVGGVMSGYCAIGSPRTAIRPASVTKIDSTDAKIGRLMKKLVNTTHLFADRHRATQERVTDPSAGGLRWSTGFGRRAGAKPAKAGTPTKTLRAALDVRHRPGFLRPVAVGRLVAVVRPVGARRGRFLAPLPRSLLALPALYRP